MISAFAAIAWVGSAWADVHPVNTVVRKTSAVVRLLPPAASEAEKTKRASWREMMARSPRKKGACYTATYPDTAWHEVPCKAPPNRLFLPPRRGTTANTVGDGTNDYVAQPTNPITFAAGTFDSVSTSSVQTEGASSGGVNGVNMFTLQLNSDYFPTSVCTAALGPKCRGWVQFVYDNSAQDAFVQYWLLNDDFTPFTAACPGSWSPAVGYCVQTAVTSGTTFPTQATAADLHDMEVTGSTTGVTVYWAGSMLAAPDTGIIPDLASNWGDAEFNVFGDGGGGAAVFTGTTAITVRTQVETGTNILPDCVETSYTGETNSLNLVSTPSIEPKKNYPSIIFNEGSGTSTASCSTSIGDPHITTFNGLYYDFYATGDFVLADAGSDFLVQARQESGAQVFHNPNVSMNTAVAVKMGVNRIAIYDSPPRVLVNGTTKSVANNEVVRLPGSVYLMRVGNCYVVSRQTGELVRAQLYNGWMDLTVGLGHRPRASTHGILASPTQRALSLRDGTVLNEPVSFDDLYQRFAKSWVVKPAESLFTDHPVAFAAPAKPITAANLDAAVYAKAHAGCVDAGVRDPAHLDACILDTAVFKDPVAIKAFARAIAPKFEIKPVARSLK
jgi:hypothetical protein